MAREAAQALLGQAAVARLSPPLLLLSLLMACGDPVAAPPDATETLGIEVRAGDAELIAVRGAGGEWRSLGAGDHDVDVAAPYEIVRVCADARVDYLRAGDGDTLLHELECDPSFGTIEVAIESETQIEVSAGSRMGFNATPLRVRPGTYDLVAIDRASDPARVKVIRRVSLPASTTVAIDMSDAVPMEARPITVTGLVEGEGTHGHVSLFTERDTWAVNFYGGGTAHVFPPSVMEGDDFQRLRAYGAATDLMRSNAIEILGTETSLTVALPDRIDEVRCAVDGGVASAEFTVAGEWPERQLSFSTTAGVQWNLHVLEHGGGEPGREVSPDLTEVPGWQPAWTLPATGLSWFLDLRREALGGRDTTGRAGTL